jgi:acetyl-CoA carboxylase carboxyltransferase component
MGKAVNMAQHLEIDAVIDPADTRKWIIRGLNSASVRQADEGGHSYVDPW